MDSIRKIMNPSTMLIQHTKQTKVERELADLFG